MVTSKLLVSLQELAEYTLEVRNELKMLEEKYDEKILNLTKAVKKAKACLYHNCSCEDSDLDPCDNPCRPDQDR